MEATGELYLFEHIRADGRGGVVFVHERRFACRDPGGAFDGWQDMSGSVRSLDSLLTRAGGRR